MALSSSRRLAAIAKHLSASQVAGEEATQELRAVRRQGHSVPKELQASGGSAVTYYENHARRLTHAEKARTLLAGIGNGTLSSVHHENGWPYGSVVNFVTEERLASSGGARLITFVSKLAEHTANMKKDPRVSLLVSVVQGEGDKLATTRATLLAKAQQVSKTEEAKKAYLAVHPNAHYVHFDDFLCFEFSVSAVRYIGGFGEMSWVGGEEFAQAEVDPISLDMIATNEAVQHCNADHADAVLEMARALSGLKNAESATMLSLDRYGFDVLCKMPDGLRRSRVEFEKRLEKGDSLRLAMVHTTKWARDLLTQT